MKKSLKGRSYPREKAKKVLRMMKISVVLMLFCLQIQANVYSQHTRLSLKLENASIKQLFTEIEKKSDVAFVYNAGDVDHLGTVNVNFTNEEIGKILDFCLKGKGVEYSFVDNYGETVHLYYITVATTGDSVDYERKVSIAVVENDTNNVNTARPEQYKLLEGLVPAGSFSGEVPVEIHCTPDMSDSTFMVHIKLVPNEDFPLAGFDNRYFKLSMTI